MRAVFRNPPAVPKRRRSPLQHQRVCLQEIKASRRFFDVQAVDEKLLAP
jgi:hypothetical protein